MTFETASNMREFYFYFYCSSLSDPSRRKNPNMASILREGIVRGLTNPYMVVGFWSLVVLVMSTCCFSYYCFDSTSKDIFAFTA
jgi:hypothetical protein